ncbi:hypothetical protein C1646_759804 [Rhizophagus diaphanus]|nr:hypothetical protein C1646_759804 [Rhizophagus diaphanus] [Rhizophagus sp. MUCL 43196]
MPRDKPKRWEIQEIIKVLKYLNDNIELWYKSPYNECVKAIEATNIIRDGKQVYNKVHGLVQDMDKFLDTGKKANNSAVIWENDEIHSLVRAMCVKSREKKRNENQETSSRTSDGDVEMNIDDQIIVSSEESTNQNNTYRNIPKLAFTVEDVNNVYNEKIKKIEELRAELIECIEIVNKKFEDFKKFQ